MNGLTTNANAGVADTDGGSTGSPVRSRIHSIGGARARGAATGLWLILLLIGFGVIQFRGSRPGRPSSPPGVWPNQSSLSRSETLPTLVMMIHPKCACSRSSLEELQRLMARCQGRVKTYVVMLCPAGSAESWISTDARIQELGGPDAVVQADLGALEARLFQTFTSGDTLIYGPRGELIFHGGLTPSRNHSGDSPGREAVERILLHGIQDVSQTPVFGCPLFSCQPGTGKAEDEWSR